MGMNDLPAYVCALMHAVPRSIQKRAKDPLKLGIQMVVSQYVGW